MVRGTSLPIEAHLSRLAVRVDEAREKARTTDADLSPGQVARHGGEAVLFAHALLVAGEAERRKGADDEEDNRNRPHHQRIGKSPDEIETAVCGSEPLSIIIGRMPLFRRSKEEPRAAENFALLERLGFFAYVGSSLHEQVEAEARRRPSRAVFDERTNRFFHGDAESLAEGDVAEFLRELEPLLNRLGVPALVLEEELDPDAPDNYAVTVNGVRHVIYSEQELTQAPSVGHAWGLAAARTVRIVDDLLRKAGSDERAWAYEGGNEFALWILTPELRDAVAAIVDSPRDEPYSMTEEWPWYGQRH